MRDFFNVAGLVSSFCSAGALEHSDAWGLALKLMLAALVCLVVTLLLPDRENY